MDLRPQNLKEYIGQEPMKQDLNIRMVAAASRNEQLGHVLIHGLPGTGKTTIAQVIANEIGGRFKSTTGMNLQTSEDILAVLLDLEPGDVLFVDEIHKSKATETLYTAMEDNRIDVIIGKGSHAKTIPYLLPAFTLIGATTTLGNLPKPLLDRFKMVYKLEAYTQDELERIVKRSCQVMGLVLDTLAIREVANRSRGTPRIVNQNLGAIRDYAQVSGNKTIGKDFVSKVFELMGIDHLGLAETERKILRGIIEKFGGDPVGLDTLCAATGEDVATVRDTCEPFLLQLGMINITKRGRVALPRAYEHLKLKSKINSMDLGV